MIGYVTLGTNDLPRATAFYDTLLGEIGAKRLWEFDRGVAWGTAPEAPSLGVMKPFDGKPATVGNGTMAGIVVPTRDAVARVHARALALGGTDEGPVGARGPDFFAGYFRDLDGNKLVVYSMA
jgi:catechol 2,3-dioxygenase-like lactoylglutathione lyase family enzyme